MRKATFISSADNNNLIATLEILNDTSPYEVAVEAGGNHYHFIYGKYINGYYISIPEWYIGCPMSDYRDYSWNKNSLERAGMTPYDAKIIAQAVSNLINTVQY